MNGVVVKQIAVPELMGSAEVAAELGMAVSNLGFVVGLPEPIQHLRCGRVWVASDIREFAEQYRARRASRQAA